MNMMLLLYEDILIAILLLFLNKFIKNYLFIDHNKSTIRQAMVNDISCAYNIVRLNVKLGLC